MSHIDYLKELKRTANIFGVYQLVYKVLEDPRFETWSGAGKDIHHHYGDGGLLKHTYEVGEYALNIADTHSFIQGDTNKLNVGELIVSFMWHDYGKIWDYQKIDGVWGKHNNHARHIHHISRSALEFQKHYDSLLDEERDMVNPDNIIHNILSHHGMREWGSPVAPATKEAWILHLADNISARLDDCDKHDRIK